MKKFQFAAGLAALAMLGACSSEEPVVNGPVLNDQESGLYLTIELATPTRATSDASQVAQSKDDDNKINKVQVLVVNKTTNALYTQLETTSFDSSNKNLAKFSVNNGIYTYMKDHASELGVIVIANYYRTLSSGQGATSDDFFTGSTSKPTWKTSDENNYGFVMTSKNVSDALASAPGPKEVDGETIESGYEGNEWMIQSDVELVRLATRFDYVEKAGGNEYTLDGNQDVTMAIDGIAPETFATSTYFAPMYSTSGKVAATGTTLDKDFVNFFTISGTKKYRVTDVVIAEGGAASYKSCNYEIKPQETGDKKVTTVYRRPNTISTDVTEELIEKNNYFDRIPYAAVRVQFHDAASEAEGGSMYMKEPVYAINGVYVGGIRDLRKKYPTRDDAKNFTIDHNFTAGSDEANKVEEVITAMQNYISNQDWTVVKYTDDMTDEQKAAAELKAYETDAKRLIENWDAEKYVYRGTEDIDIQRGLHGYYTYYAKFITHDNSSTAALWDKYGVSRNFVYQIGVNSIGFLGNNGGGNVGDGPKKSDLSDLYINMTIKVANWLVNPNNAAWKF